MRRFTLTEKNIGQVFSNSKSNVTHSPEARFLHNFFYMNLISEELEELGEMRKVKTIVESFPTNPMSKQSTCGLGLITFILEN